MPAPVTLRPVLTRGTRYPLPRRRTATVLRLFDCYEWEVQFDDALLHTSLLDWTEYHNAYDADENGTAFRADAIFVHERGRFTVPIYAAKDAKGRWTWRLRFRPHYTGSWLLEVYVLHRHVKRHPRGEPGAPVPVTYGSRTVQCYQHALGPTRVLSFGVLDKAPYLEGPLEAPNRSAGDNGGYFYRREADGKRRAQFLMGFARPWVTRTSDKESTPTTRWDSYLKRDTELFQPMVAQGCNVLSHWMAPGETQLVHQSEQECWSQRGAMEGYFSGFPGRKYSGAKLALAYKRYDQGRASHTDRIFDQARVVTGDERQTHVLLLVAVMPHSLLQDGDATTAAARKHHQTYGSYPGHHWNEWAWKESHPDRKVRDSTGATVDVANKLNGFHFFETTPGKKLSIDEFFRMRPGDGGWENRLWKHFANYWRYVIARWTAHPALGAWVLMDELEGVGRHSTWWWADGRRTATYAWHDRLVAMVRGKGPTWGTVEGRDLYYTGDYLQHPITSSTTHYEGSSPGNYLPHGSTKAKLLEDFRATGDSGKASALLDGFDDLKDRGDWLGNPASTWKTDFVSHHAYQAVPYWGHWGTCTDPATKHRMWRYWPNTVCPPPRRDSRQPRTYDLVLPNEEDPSALSPDRWLWDSLCTRLWRWSTLNKNRTMLVTEYGCLERDDARESWDRYGRRVPALTHYANWAALVLGHAGVPLKWTDGAKFGEMAAHPRAPAGSIWHRSKYPVDNYRQVRNVGYFLKRFAVDLAELHPEEWEVVDAGNRPDKRLRAWALANAAGTTFVIWAYDRTFTTNGRDPGRWLRTRSVDPSFTFRLSWYDTWAGRPMVSALAGSPSTATPDKAGVLRIALPAFPTVKDRTVVSSGNDIALHLAYAAR